MSTTTKIKEFQVSEHNVFNGVGWSGAVPVTAGTAVTWLSSSGFRAADTDLGIAALGGATYGNTVSTRWTVGPLVRAATSGDTVLGILRYDMRETDENGNTWRAYPQKWAENNWLVSGQGNAVITAGFVFISGVGGVVQAGNPVYASGDGNLFAGGSGQFDAVYRQPSKVGVVYGAEDHTKYALIKIQTAY